MVFLVFRNCYVMTVKDNMFILGRASSHVGVDLFNSCKENVRHFNIVRWERDENNAKFD